MQVAGTNPDRLLLKPINGVWEARLKGGFSATATGPQGEKLSAVTLEYAGNGDLAFTNKNGQNSKGSAKLAGKSHFGFDQNKQYKRCCSVKVGWTSKASAVELGQTIEYTFDLGLSFYFHKERPKGQ